MIMHNSLREGGERGGGRGRERGSAISLRTSFAGFLQEELVKDLLEECLKMKEFDHPNVLEVRGVCLDGGPAPYIIMPFMKNGSLLSYLQENRASLVLDPSSTDPHNVVCIS